MAKAKEWMHFEQTFEVLGRIVPLEVHDQAVREILRSDATDEQSLKAAALRAVQHFVDFFAAEFHGRPEITPEAIEDAARHMTLGVVEEFKKAALIQIGGFSPEIAPDVPITWN